MIANDTAILKSISFFTKKTQSVLNINLDFRLSKRSVSRQLLKFSSTGEIGSLRKQNCIEPYFMRKNKNTEVLINWMKMGEGLGFCNAKKEMFVFESSRATTFMKVATHTHTPIFYGFWITIWCAKKVPFDFSARKNFISTHPFGHLLRWRRVLLSQAVNFTALKIMISETLGKSKSSKINLNKWFQRHR